MEAVDSLFEQPQQLVDWGKEALAEASAAGKEFLSDERNFALVTEKDEQTGGTIGKLKILNPIPSVVTRKLTESLNNSRNAFDQALFAACAAVGKPVRDGHFPWATDPDDLERRFVHYRTKAEIIPSELWEVIRFHEPYPRGEGYSGGHDPMREIAKLANTKHTVGFRVAADIAKMEMKPFAGLVYPGFEMPGMVWDKEKNEMVLFRDPSGKTKLNTNCEFSFYVTFDRPPPLGGLDAAYGLSMFNRMAQSVIKHLKARCLDAAYKPRVGM